MDISKLATNAEQERDGVWVDYDDGASFKIRSTDTPAYRKFITKATRRIPAGVLKRNPEKLRAISLEAMAAEVLVDWKGVEENGKPLPCTAENKLKLLALAPLRDFIAEESQDLQNFREEALAAEADEIKSGS